MFTIAAVCVELEPLVNGRIDYTPVDMPFFVDTVATYSCNNGYTLIDGPVNRTCEESDTGEEGIFNPPQTPICDRKS